MTHTATPGPWTFSKSDEFGGTRFYVSQQDGAPYTPEYSDVATLIAETVSGERVAIQLANAKLIAAAPELLAALNDLKNGGHLIVFASDSDEDAQIKRKAISVIEKAQP